MVFKTGVVKLFPEPTEVVPKGVEYQVKAPAGGAPVVDAVRVTLPLPQRVSFAATMS